LLSIFTIVQYNDPDAPVWIIIYGLPAIWAGLAAYRPGAFAQNEWLRGALGLNLLAIAAGAIYMWPNEISTWWQKEEIREGLGLGRVAKLVEIGRRWVRGGHGGVDQAARSRSVGERSRLGQPSTRRKVI
jgi:hypothetical protein